MYIQNLIIIMKTVYNVDIFVKILHILFKKKTF